MRTGIDAVTGRVLSGWDHCAQSIGICIATRLASRVMRRHLGSLVKPLQDENADPRTILHVYCAIAEALADPDGGEPGFNLTGLDLVESSRTGRFLFILEGQYFPLGHRGDYSVREDRNFPFEAGGVLA